MPFPPISYPPLPLHIAEHAQHRPDHPAIVEGDQIITYGELDDMVRRGASKLRERHVRHGDRIMVALSRKSDLTIGVLASMAAGGSVLPVSLTEEDIAPIAQYFDPAVIIADPDQAQTSQICNDFPILPVEKLYEAAPEGLSDLTFQDIGLLILTSGTTQGQRRGALLSHRSLSGTAQYMNDRMGVDSSVRDLVTAPLEHGFGMGRVRCALHAGGTAIFQSGLFSPKAVIAGLERYDCNMLSASVSAVALLLDSDSDALTRFSNSIRWIEMGTGHLRPAHRRLLTRQLPKARCFLTYGLTEAIRSTFLELTADEGKIDTVGKATPWVHVRVVGEQDEALPAGETGQIQVNGVNKASGYFRYDEAWNKKQVGDWLDTGDLGFLDEDGYLTFVGRTDDMINVGGLKVAPEEVETALVSAMGERSFAIASVPDPRGIEGFVPGLFIETTDDEQLVSLDAVRQHLRNQLPEFKIPRVVHRVEQFPRTKTTRKIRRAALTKIAADLATAKIPNTNDLVTGIEQSGRGNWPAIIGRTTLSRKRMMQFVRGTRLTGFNDQTTRDIAVFLRKAMKEDDEQLGALVGQFRDFLPVSADGVMAIDVPPEANPIYRAILLHCLSAGGAGLLLPPFDDSSIAEDLGLIRCHRARHVIIDGDRFSRLAKAEGHLSDSFDYSEFERILIVKQDPDSATLALFERTFGFFPDKLARRGDRWSVRKLRPSLDGSAAGSLDHIWSILRDTASIVFQVDAQSLGFESSPENTPGWNSLGFVNLIMAVEESFSVNLKPRDVMAVRQLGDLAGILVRESSE